MEIALLVLGTLALSGVSGALVMSIARNRKMAAWNTQICHENEQLRVDKDTALSWLEAERKQKLEAHEVSRRRKDKIAEMYQKALLLRAAHNEHIAKVTSEHQAEVAELDRQYLSRFKTQVAVHEASLAALADEHADGVDEVVQEVHESYRQRIRSLEWSLEATLEPSRRSDDECGKLRFHRVGEAEAFARELEIQDHLPEGSMRPYPCKACPRSPWTIEPYFHITSDGWSRGVKSAKPKPNKLGDRIDPQALAALKQKMNGERRA